MSLNFSEIKRFAEPKYIGTLLEWKKYIGDKLYDVSFQECYIKGFVKGFVLCLILNLISICIICIAL